MIRAIGTRTASGCSRNLLSPKLRQSVEAHDAEIDWQRVGDLAHSPRAVPVPVTGTNEGIDAVLAQSVLVENTLPTGSNWDGKSGLLVDEKTFNELVGGRTAAPSSAAQTQAVAKALRNLRRCGVAGILLVCAAGVAAAADLNPIQSGLDYHSFANTEQFRVTHLELNLRVDFTNQVLIGVVALEIKRLDPTATELVLDTRDLDVLRGHREADECSGRDRQEPDDLGESTFSLRQGRSHSG